MKNLKFRFKTSHGWRLPNAENTRNCEPIDGVGAIAAIAMAAIHSVKIAKNIY